MSNLIKRLRKAATNTNLTNEAADRIEELEEANKLLNKRVDWTVSDNVKKATQLDKVREVASELHTESCGICNDGSCKYCNFFRKAIGANDAAEAH